MEKASIAGSIVKITRGNNGAVVKFDKPHEGIEYGIIGIDTQGCVQLRNASPEGKLVEGTRVHCATERMRKGRDAFFVAILAFPE